MSNPIPDTWLDQLSTTALTAVILGYLRDHYMPDGWTDDERSAAVTVEAGQTETIVTSGKLPAIYVVEGEEAHENESISRRQFGIKVDDTLLNPKTASMASGSLLIRIRSSLKTEAANLRDDVCWYLGRKRDAIADQLRMENFAVAKGGQVTKPQGSDVYQADVLCTWYRRYNLEAYTATIGG